MTAPMDVEDQFQPSGVIPGILTGAFPTPTSALNFVPRDALQARGTAAIMDVAADTVLGKRKELSGESPEVPGKTLAQTLQQNVDVAGLPPPLKRLRVAGATAAAGELAGARTAAPMSSVAAIHGKPGTAPAQAILSEIPLVRDNPGMRLTVSNDYATTGGINHGKATPVTVKSVLNAVAYGCTSGMFDLRTVKCIELPEGMLVFYQVDAKLSECAPNGPRHLRAIPYLNACARLRYIESYWGNAHNFTQHWRKASVTMSGGGVSTGVLESTNRQVITHQGVTRGVVANVPNVFLCCNPFPDNGVYLWFIYVVRTHGHEEEERRQQLAGNHTAQMKLPSSYDQMQQLARALLIRSASGARVRSTTTARDTLASLISGVQIATTGIGLVPPPVGAGGHPVGTAHISAGLAAGGPTIPGGPSGPSSSSAAFSAESIAAADRGDAGDFKSSAFAGSPAGGLPTGTAEVPPGLSVSMGRMPTVRGAGQRGFQTTAPPRYYRFEPWTSKTSAPPPTEVYNTAGWTGLAFFFGRVTDSGHCGHYRETAANFRPYINRVLYGYYSEDHDTTVHIRAYDQLPKIRISAAPR